MIQLSIVAIGDTREDAAMEADIALAHAHVSELSSMDATRFEWKFRHAETGVPDGVNDLAALERVAKAALAFQVADRAYDNSLLSPKSQERFQDRGMAMRWVIDECEALPAPLRERLMRDDP